MDEPQVVLSFMTDIVQAGGKRYVKTAMKLHREAESGCRQAEMLIGLQVLVLVVHAGLLHFLTVGCQHVVFYLWKRQANHHKAE